MGLEPHPLNMQKYNDNRLLKQIFTFHTFQIIFFTFPHTQIQILARHGHEPTLFPFFHIPFFHFSHPNIYIAGILGKNGVGPPHFIHIIPIPKSKFRHVLGKNGLGTQPAKYSFVFCVSLMCLGTAYANGV